MGVKCIGFAAVTNPATGTTDGSWVHDGEHNLIAARKCLDGLRKTIWKVVEKFDFKADYQFKFTHDSSHKTLQVKKLSREANLQQMSKDLINRINKWNNETHFDFCLWIASDPTYHEFMLTLKSQI